MQVASVTASSEAYHPRERGVGLSNSRTTPQPMQAMTSAKASCAFSMVQICGVVGLESSTGQAYGGFGAGPPCHAVRRDVQPGRSGSAWVSRTAVFLIEKALPSEPPQELVAPLERWGPSISAHQPDYGTTLQGGGTTRGNPVQSVCLDHNRRTGEYNHQSPGKPQYNTSGITSSHRSIVTTAARGASRWRKVAPNLEPICLGDIEEPEVSRV
ncbi:hypothetical protein LTR10_003961 [Elasticomyces elasticus]|nr:hypothetical protein LTR10_003961 [Elasticomyces elasticus]KAK4977852.1 hypothetical protein LTR42_002227 [Elasticomyces elasticus]